MDSTTIEQLQQLIWKHERELTVFELISRKNAIEEHGLPCRLELASKEDGYMMIKTIPLQGWVHLGSENWLATHPYDYHTTIGWVARLTWDQSRQIWGDWERMKDALPQEVRLTGKFSSAGSLCFHLDEASVAALGPLAKQWAEAADPRGYPMHISM